MKQLLQPCGYSGLLLSEVTLLVSGLEHLPVLHNDTQTPVEMNGLQQPLDSCREHFRRAYLPAELPKASFLVFVGLYFFHGRKPFLQYNSSMIHIINQSLSSNSD